MVHNRKIINLLTRNAIFGGTRHVDYISSKSALYSASRTLSNEYKDIKFLNLLCGPLGFEKGQLAPDLISEKIISLFNLKMSNNYRDIYFESKTNYIQFIIKNILKYLKNLKNINT